MCRLFAVRADRPVSAEPALVSAPHALVRQSCCDLRGECHPSGWGIGYFVDGSPARVRSTRPASDDPKYIEASRTVVSPVLIGHVRQASVGRVSEANTHPFVHGRWLFAHNGTLQGFGDDPEPLRRLIRPGLRERIEGETDSEHLFHFLLGRIERKSRLDAGVLAGVVGEALREVAGRYSGTAEEPTRLNVVLTDGDHFLATRWGHSLHMTELPTPDVVAGDGRGTAIASEPMTASGWSEVPDRHVVIVQGGRRALVIQVG
jgi:predicted glutamine amidotransferase